MPPAKKPVALHKPLNDALTSLLENRRKTPKKKEPTEVVEKAPQMSLELWPDAVRGVPNAILRGSLFTIGQERPTSKKRELLASVDGIEIRFKGERFNQTDLDVWEMLVHIARQQPLGDSVNFSAHSLLKALNRGVGKSQHEQLKEEIARLRAGTVEVTWTKQGKTYIGGLIANAYRDDDTDRYVVVFDSKMSALFDSGYSYVDWEQRKGLKQNNLAKWLHGFYASHAAPYAYKVENIRSLCGSTTARLGDFRKSLRAALDELKGIGAIRSWEITATDLLKVEKVPTLSQQRHLKLKGTGVSSRGQLKS